MNTNKKSNPSLRKPPCVGLELKINKMGFPDFNSFLLTLAGAKLKQQMGELQVFKKSQGFSRIGKILKTK